MDPQQELFTMLRSRVLALGYDVYDGSLPPEGTPYPFVYLGGNDANDIETKSFPIGEVTQTIDVWHDDPEKRGTVSAMMLGVKQAARSIYSTENFGWQVRRVGQTILPDNSTGQPLLHGVLTITYQFS